MKSQKRKIGVFADIGCAIRQGAPTTVEAKKMLGKKKVYAVDIRRPTDAMEENMRKQGLTVVMHSITKEPLPFECNAIRFANVAQHMTKRERRSALRNIWKSLKVGGFLLGATAARVGVEEFILKKTERGWEEVILD